MKDIHTRRFYLYYPIIFFFIGFVFVPAHVFSSSFIRENTVFQSARKAGGAAAITFLLIYRIILVPFINFSCFFKSYLFNYALKYIT